MLRIDSFKRRDLANLRLSELPPKAFQNYIEERLKESSDCGKPISPSTVRREFTVIRAAINWGKNQGYITNNPTLGVKLPKEPEHRERIASSEDIAKLLFVCDWDGKSIPKNTQQLVILAFLFACRTGMRSGEIIQLEECWVEGNVIHLPKEVTKTRSKRDVALTTTALKLLNLASGTQLGTKKPTVFYPLNDSLRDALWRKIRDKADLSPVLDSKGNVVKEGLHFHDSRATFATWAASPDPRTGAPRLDVLALARQTGHHDLSMLQRYYRASAVEIADRLSEAEIKETNF